MIGIVIVTHLKLGEELLAAAELIVGKLKQFQAVSIDPKEDVEEIKEKISAAIRAVDRGKGILILTDMFGGTPSNISLSFLEEWKIEVITGVNLPMLLKLSTQDIRAEEHQSGQRDIEERCKGLAKAMKS
jgi:PTS system mannose-specific IIA component